MYWHPGWSVHLLERTFPTRPQIPYDPLWSKKSSCSHRPHMNHCGQIPRYRCAFWIPPPEDQCGTVTGGECVYHTATHPTWTIVDLVWNRCAFWIPPHEDQCGTLTGGDCVYHPDHWGPCVTGNTYEKKFERQFKINSTPSNARWVGGGGIALLCSVLKCNQ